MFSFISLHLTDEFSLHCAQYLLSAFFYILTFAVQFAAVLARRTLQHDYFCFTVSYSVLFQPKFTRGELIVVQLVHLLTLIMTL